MALQEPYWRGVFQTALRHDDHRPPPKGHVEWSLVCPITVEDVTRAIKGMSDGAPGPDGQTLNDMQALRCEEVAAHFNLWLLAGYPPDQLRRGETVLPKKRAHIPPEALSDYLPGHYPAVLATCFETSLPWNTCQKAFMKGDGVADSIWLLQTIIPTTKHRLSRHFKSRLLTRSAMRVLLAAKWMGIPAPMLGYLGELYRDTWTVLRIGSDRSEPIGMSWGVRQGDPLTVYLCNAAIDWALNCSNPELGVMVGEVRVNARHLQMT